MGALIFFCATGGDSVREQLLMLPLVVGLAAQGKPTRHLTFVDDAA